MSARRRRNREASQPMTWPEKLAQLLDHGNGYLDDLKGRDDEWSIQEYAEGRQMLGGLDTQADRGKRLLLSPAPCALGKRGRFDIAVAALMMWRSSGALYRIDDVTTWALAHTKPPAFHLGETPVFSALGVRCAWLQPASPLGDGGATIGCMVVDSWPGHVAVCWWGNDDVDADASLDTGRTYIVDPSRPDGHEQTNFALNLLVAMLKTGHIQTKAHSPTAPRSRSLRQREEHKGRSYAPYTALSLIMKPDIARAVQQHTPGQGDGTGAKRRAHVVRGHWARRWVKKPKPEDKPDATRGDGRQRVARWIQPFIRGAGEVERPRYAVRLVEG